MQDKRKEERVAVDFWVEAEREGELYFQRAANLSRGGVYFSQTIPLPVGTIVSLKFALPGDPHEIKCHGAIVAAKDFGMGVNFQQLAQEDRARIEKALELARAVKS